MSQTRLSPPRRFLLRTHGCQMNVHDSEKVANLLCHAGLVATPDAERADLTIINTCSIRDKAEHRLYSELGMLREWKAAQPGRVLGVGGCVAQQEGDALLRRFPYVDFVFGTHNLRLVPTLVEAAARGNRWARVDESRSLDRFDLPERHPDLDPVRPGRAYVTVLEGCDLFCSFCIVPRTRGREISRPAESILTEVETLAAAGVREITLLGQTVNAYGRRPIDRGSRAQRAQAAPDLVPFARLLSRLAEIRGLARIRYTSPHPLFFDEALIRAHAELPSLCPHVHLPVQSGSDRVLDRMRRRYRREDYLRLVARLRSARPDLAITTDLIVGFPGETDADFEQTLSLVQEVGFTDSFSFKYSPRPGTAAVREPGPVDPSLAQSRLERLQALQFGLTQSAHRARVGQRTEVLVEGPSRRGAGQWSGRDPYHRIVNVAAGSRSLPPTGTLVGVRIVEATPHSLIGEMAADPDAPAVGASGASGKSRESEKPGESGKNRARAVEQHGQHWRSAIPGA